MVDKMFIGILHTEDQILNKIAKLKMQGYSENHIYVVANDIDSLPTVRRQTHVNIRVPEGSWLDQLKSFLDGDEPVTGAFKHMGFSKEEALRFYKEVKSGGILLYVNHKHEKRFNHQEVGIQDHYVNPNLPLNNHNDTFFNQNKLNVDARQEKISETLRPQKATIKQNDSFADDFASTPDNTIESDWHEHNLLDEDLYDNPNNI